MSASSRPLRPSPRQRGFTLVELVIVVLLMGVLSFVAFGRLNDRSEARARGFADQVSSGLRFAQQAAVAQRRPIFVRINGNQLRACLDAAPECAQPLAAPWGGALALVAPQGVTLLPNETVFSFDGLGRPSLATSLSLSVSSAAGAFPLVVERDSGYVRGG